MGYAQHAMIALIEENARELFELCRKFQVERLDLFGSAATTLFEPNSSDLDFVVEFTNRAPGTYLDRYLDFADALEALFQRPVDLITERAIHNPYFRRSLELTRRTVYERRNEEAAA
jgi:predicted nucleotidyltransferase